MAVIFDGRRFAAGIENQIKVKVAGWKRPPKLVSFYDLNDAGSRIYTRVKEKKAEELGIGFEKIQITNYTNSQIKSQIRDFNNEEAVDGIMVQLPMEGSSEFIAAIDPQKDVDGLREDSPFLPATVRAVLAILQTLKKGEVVVVGNKGEVGKRLVKVLGCEGMDKEDFDPSALLRADVIISATGVPDLIKPEMVKPGVECVDVGYPKGDFSPEVAKKAAFFTPVPGGVGPVTVAMLFANLVKLKSG